MQHRALWDKLKLKDQLFLWASHGSKFKCHDDHGFQRSTPVLGVIMMGQAVPRRSTILITMLMRQAAVQRSNVVIMGQFAVQKSTVVIMGFMIFCHTTANGFQDQLS
jgi:hypothetical protein